MTSQEQQAAIAGLFPAKFVLIKRGLYYRPDACGYTACIDQAWKISEEEADKHVYPHDEPVTKRRAPDTDFLNDLNAMHEAEMTLTKSQREDMWDVLATMILDTEGMGGILCATAAQRAEALCRTLWPERFT